MMQLIRNNSNCWSFNEGGHWLTITLWKKSVIPGRWLRLYIGYGKWHKIIEL